MSCHVGFSIMFSGIMTGYAGRATDDRSAERAGSFMDPLQMLLLYLASLARTMPDVANLCCGHLLSRLATFSDSVYIAARQHSELYIRTTTSRRSSPHTCVIRFSKGFGAFHLRESRLPNNKYRTLGIRQNVGSWPWHHRQRIYRAMPSTCQCCKGG